MPNLNTSILRSVPVVFPSLTEQKAIADTLKSYDDLIENNLRRIRILEDMAQSLYREWFVHFRFPGHEKTKMTDSPLGPIPQGWGVNEVDAIIERLSVGKKYDKNSSLETGMIPILDQGKTGIIGYHNDEPGVECSLEKPVVIFANHTCYQRIIFFPFSAIQNVLPYKSKNETHDIYWLYWATKGLVSLSEYKGHWPEFAKKLVITPKPDLSEQFGEYVAPKMKLIYCLELQNESLAKIRDLLLPKLISAEIDLTAAASKLKEAV